MKKCILFIFTLLIASFQWSCSPSMEHNDALIQELLEARPNEFAHILENMDQYEVQIVYTQINRDENNNPTFTTYTHNTDKSRYFYPASTIKLPAALLALEKINTIDKKGLDKNTVMRIDSIRESQTRAFEDSTAAMELPSLAHFIKKVLVVSDNDGFNRLYEWLGQKGLNMGLWEKGYDDVRLTHRLSIPLPTEENRHTNPIAFLAGGEVIHQQEPLYSDRDIKAPDTILKGRGYLEEDTLVNEPFDFTNKNFIPLEDLQMILQSVIFPESVAVSARFGLNPDDYRFLYRYLSQLPSETEYPNYDLEQYHDAYVKFLMYGSEKGQNIPSNIRIYNKVGIAYGYVTDNAYIVDFDNNVEFFLSATIHTNSNQIFNDGIYEYDSIALPFMQDLGQAVYQHELKRKKTNAPDLSRFKLAYEKPHSDMKLGNFHDLEAAYYQYHLSEFGHRWIAYDSVARDVNQLKASDKFKVTTVGTSIDGREISMVQYGAGKIPVLLWSQMHGDESTATRAMMEIFNFLNTNDQFDPLRETLAQELSIYFIPMLNPDGAELYQRRNILEIDMNRDAVALQGNESLILKTAVDTIKPKFGFNLHDQNRRYNAMGTSNPATISFLAPPADQDRTHTESRIAAMKVIAGLNKVLQEIMPGHIGRYDDTFEPRAFGDNIQKWGTAAILVESGGAIGDREKITSVKAHFIGLLHALEIIATGTYQKNDIEDYLNIPENDTKMVDLIIRNATITRNGKDYSVDIGIEITDEKDHDQKVFYRKGTIKDIGDLSVFHGYQTIDATGLYLKPGMLYIGASGHEHLLKTGYTGILVENDLSGDYHFEQIQKVCDPENYKPIIAIDEPADLVLFNKEGNVRFTILNGAVFDWEKGFNNFKNALYF